MQAFCLPSMGLESFGNAAVEAMAFGLPTIVFSVIVTCSPNGSSGKTMIAGGGVGLGVCAAAPDRPKPAKATANASNRVRETAIEVSLQDKLTAALPFGELTC